MRIADVMKVSGAPDDKAHQKNKNDTGFSRVLDNVAQAEGEPLKSDNIIELGRISRETPTVSHILKKHPDFTGKCWDIIFSSLNRGKEFSKMREGTVVALKTDSNELVWGKTLSPMKGNARVQSSEQGENTSQGSGLQNNSIIIGTISRDNPTVSHLLHAHSEFRAFTYDIINSPANHTMNYTSLRPGTKVAIDPETMKLTFMNNHKSTPDSQTVLARLPEQSPAGENINHASLADAVKTYIGTPYNKIDCYGLVVRGLMNQGIQYTGQGGLREMLESTAADKGIAQNAYFNGEGLVEIAGTRIFSKSMQNISNAGEKTEEIYSEVAPHLREGLILSFSTPTRGHTGIVSRQGNDWTYINSGVIDNQISPGRVSKRVGEEFLKAEINNWCKLAAGRKEPLMVTIGHLDGQLQRSNGSEKI